MKTLKTIFALALVGLGLTALSTSCNKIDGTENATPAAQEVAGNYSGDMTVSVMGQNIPFEDLTFSLTAVDEETVSLGTPSFSYGNMVLPAISIAELKVTSGDGVCTLSQTEFSGTTDDGKAYSGTVAGTVKDNTLTVNITLNYGSMPMPMVISFTGTKN